MADDETRNRIDPAELARSIDHTLLKPDATREQVLRVVGEAAEHGFAAVCIPPCYVEEAAQVLERSAEDGRSPVAVCTVISFPLGYADPQVRIAESRRAVAAGARELDTVINVSRLKGGEAGWVLDDLSGWVEALRATDVELVLKVILETALLTDDEKRRAAGLVADAGADFVKTSTGFGGGRGDGRGRAPARRRGRRSAADQGLRRHPGPGDRARHDRRRRRPPGHVERRGDRRGGRRS